MTHSTTTKTIKTRRTLLVDGITASPRRRASHIEHVQTTVLVRNVRHTSQMWLSSAKVFGVLSLAFLLTLSISSVGGTVSYFNDTESSIGNYLRAGTTGFTLSSGNDVGGRLTALALASGPATDTAPVENNTESGENNIGSEAFVVATGQNDDSLPLSYSAHGVLDPSAPAGCSILNLDATFGDYHYNGSFTAFASPATTTMGEWHFLVSLPVDNDLPSDAVCNGKIVFDVGLANVSSELSHTFSQVKDYTFSITNWPSVSPPAGAPSPEPSPDPVVVPPPPVDTSSTTVDTVVDTSTIPPASDVVTDAPPTPPTDPVTQ